MLCISPPLGLGLVFRELAWVDAGRWRCSARRPARAARPAAGCSRIRRRVRASSCASTRFVPLFGRRAILRFRKYMEAQHAAPIQCVEAAQLTAARARRQGHGRRRVHRRPGRGQRAPPRAGGGGQLHPGLRPRAHGRDRHRVSAPGARTPPHVSVKTFSGILPEKARLDTSGIIKVYYT